MSKIDYVMEALEAKIDNIQQGVDHYKTRLKEIQGEEVALTENLSKKEVELKRYKSELRDHMDRQEFTMMTPEQEAAFAKNIADHAETRKK
jgi:rubrerythrin